MWTLTDVVDTFQKFETHTLCAVCVHSDFSQEDNVKYDLFNAVPSTRECVRDLKVSAPVCTESSVCTPEPEEAFCSF